MQLLRELRRRLDPLLEPARDPRVAFGDLTERRELLLARVREASRSAAGARRRLEARIGDARGLLEQSVSGSDPVPQDEHRAPSGQLRDLVARELHELEEELRSLDREQDSLRSLERRLDAELNALRLRQGVADARNSTHEAQGRVRDTLDAIGRELTELAGSVERAERRAGRIDASVAAIGELDPGSPVADAGTTARWLGRRFEIEAQDVAAAALRDELEAGRDTAARLAGAYERLLPALTRRREADPIALVSLPGLVDESYRHGTSALEAALELARAACVANRSASVVEEPPAATQLLRRHSSELIAQAQRCCDALERTRVELAGISTSRSAEGIEAVTRRLLAALERARAVQAELRTETARSAGAGGVDRPGPEESRGAGR